MHWWLEGDDVLVEAQREQADRLQPDPWLGVIERFIDGHGSVTTAAILGECFKKAKSEWERNDEMRVAGLLRRLGWERSKRRIEGTDRSERCYKRTKS